MKARRGTSNSNTRGSALARRVRKAWLMHQFGDGNFAPCYWCEVTLPKELVEIDRYPKCGHDGGTYSISNIVPSCAKCNRERCTVAKKCQEANS